MSYDKALAAPAGIEWDAYSINECQEEMPIRGCDLKADPKRSYYPSIAGFMLLPSLQFNESGQLTDIRFGRTYSARVNAKQCEDMHARLIDALTAKFGPARHNPKDDAPRFRTPRGNIYLRNRDPSEIMVAGFELFRTASDRSEISALTTFSSGSKYTEPECRIGFTVEGPKSLKRAPIPTQAEIEARYSISNDAEEASVSEMESDEGEPAEAMADDIEGVAPDPGNGSENFAE